MTFADGSQFAVEVAGDGSGDLLHVADDVTLNGGTVNVMPTSDTYNTTMNYTIINTTNGGMVSGQFSDVVSTSVFVDPSLVYNNASVLVTLTPNSFESVALTDTHFSLAAAIAELGAGHGAFDGLFHSATVAEAHAALENLSGEAHASNLGAIFDNPWFREGILSRLRNDGAAASSDSGGDGWNYWTLRPEAYFAWSRLDGDGNAAAADIDTVGTMIGADRTSDRFTYGFAAGYQHDNVDVDDRWSSTDIDTANLGAYGAWDGDGWTVRGGGIVAWHWFDSSRTITVPMLEGEATANYSGWSGQAFGEAGYRFGRGAATIEPFGGLRYAYAWRDAFSESGEGDADLTAESKSLSSLFSVVGLDLAATFDYGNSGRSVKPHMTLAWEHAFSDIDPSAELGFAGFDHTFTVLGPTVGQDTFRGEVGVDIALSNRTTAFVGYQIGYASGALDQAARAGASVRF